MDITIKVGIIIKNEKEEILLLKEKLDKHDLPLWNIVKGSYGDTGEEDIFQAAIRECLEETSTKVSLKAGLGTYISKEKEKIRVQFNFLATIVGGEAKIANFSEQEKRGEAILELKWFSKDEISKLKKEDFISNRIYKVVENYLTGEHYPLEIYKQVKM